MGVSAFFNLPQSLFQRINPTANVPAVTFQLTFTGAARADAAAEPGKALTFTSKARQCVVELCELDLNFALAASGTLGENIQNQRGTVHDAHAGFLFQIALLRGA